MAILCIYMNFLLKKESPPLGSVTWPLHFYVRLTSQIHGGVSSITNYETQFRPRENDSNARQIAKLRPRRLRHFTQTTVVERYRERSRATAQIEYRFKRLLAVRDRIFAVIKFAIRLYHTQVDVSDRLKENRLNKPLEDRGLLRGNRTINDFNALINCPWNSQAARRYCDGMGWCVSLSWKDYIVTLFFNLSLCYLYIKLSFRFNFFRW